MRLVETHHWTHGRARHIKTEAVRTIGVLGSSVKGLRKNSDRLLKNGRIESLTRLQVVLLIKVRWKSVDHS